VQSERGIGDVGEEARRLMMMSPPMFLKRYDFKRVREWGLVNDVISLDLEDRHRKQGSGPWKEFRERCVWSFEIQRKGSMC